MIMQINLASMYAYSMKEIRVLLQGVELTSTSKFRCYIYQQKLVDPEFDLAIQRIACRRLIILELLHSACSPESRLLLSSQ